MAVVKADMVRKALIKKGFVEGSGKHVVYQFYAAALIDTPVLTHMSHNKQEIDHFLQQHMANQLHLSKHEFMNLISCTFGYADLIERYTALDLIPKER